MDTFISSEDPNEMPYATFNLGLHCYGKINFRQKILFFIFFFLLKL